jgi:hypothetical protein
LIATLTLDVCREIARTALEMQTADAVRAVVSRALPQPQASAAEG